MKPAGWCAAAGTRPLASPSKVPFQSDVGRIHLDPDHAFFFEKLRANVGNGEAAFVPPEINGLDVLFGTERIPFPVHLPGWLDRGAERMLVKRFDEQPPDLVVLFPRETREYGKPRFGKGYDFCGNGSQRITGRLCGRRRNSDETGRASRPRRAAPRLIAGVRVS